LNMMLLKTEWMFSRPINNILNEEFVETVGIAQKEEF
jgi:hypothetical protein